MYNFLSSSTSGCILPTISSPPLPTSPSPAAVHAVHTPTCSLACPLSSVTPTAQLSPGLKTPEALSDNADANSTVSVTTSAAAEVDMESPSVIVAVFPLPTSPPVPSDIIQRILPDPAFITLRVGRWMVEQKGCNLKDLEGTGCQSYPAQR
ncbi:hypothetical protein PQX77_015507 [Marasmius sp. AFHP31]|nr:hypothetical protein PQX77_015507 [Marasmius sp. AFHP31]